MTSFPGMPVVREFFSSVHQRFASSNLAFLKDGLGKYLVSEGKLPCPFLLVLGCLTCYLAWRDDDEEIPSQVREMLPVAPNPRVQQAVSQALPIPRPISPILPDPGSARNVERDAENSNLVFQPKKNLKKFSPNETSSRLLSTAPPGGPLPDFAMPVPLAPHQTVLKSLLTEVESLSKEMKKRATPVRIETWKQHLTEIQEKMSALESSALLDSDFEANHSLADSKKSLKLSQDPAHLKKLSVKLDSLHRQMKTKATSIQVLAWKEFLTEIQEEIRKSSN